MNAKQRCTTCQRREDAVRIAGKRVECDAPGNANPRRCLWYRLASPTGDLEAEAVRHDDPLVDSEADVLRTQISAKQVRIDELERRVQEEAAAHLAAREAAARHQEAAEAREHARQEAVAAADAQKDLAQQHEKAADAARTALDVLKARESELLDTIEQRVVRSLRAARTQIIVLSAAAGLLIGAAAVWLYFAQHMRALTNLNLGKGEACLQRSDLACARRAALGVLQWDPANVRARTLRARVYAAAPPQGAPETRQSATDDCGRHFHANESYASAQQGEDMQTAGAVRLTIRDLSPCPDGTGMCFTAAVWSGKRGDGADSADEATGTWSQARFRLTRSVAPEHAAQIWSGQCMTSAVKGVWYMEAEPSRNGPFSIVY